MIFINKFNALRFLHHRDDAILFKYKIFNLESAVPAFIRIVPRDRFYDPPHR
ncbi:hypothetical protein ETAE_1158 [Edwardsiella piscicida]|uniref:Uncharacterized protein n=2 Tax=Edwardsiella TaxID=635 RepID=A0A0H3DPH8_EDWTF|nr:hypothetical protein ETAE_1158 [Edwardsiella tarda EIB202]ADM41199.1 hypothetical protein ETAF_1080 [Edwardsiella tarda FL6-60]